MPETRFPSLFIPHGGGPCFFMEWTMGPPNTWESLRRWLEGIPCLLPRTPRAIVVVSAHWETDGFAVAAVERPGMIYDYSGFPEHTYHIEYPAPGSRAVAARVAELGAGAGETITIDTTRGFDHGVFVPLKVAFPDATIPVVVMSLDRSLDPGRHVALGRALAPLRDEEVLMIGSGMSFHNLRAFFSGSQREESLRFDRWLTSAVCEPDARTRDHALTEWESAPGAKISHPHAEHLLPLMVIAGAAGADRGVKLFEDEIMGHPISAFGFGT